MTKEQVVMSQIVVDDRGTGKSHTLAAWLLGGHKVDGWPGWSRVLIVPTAQHVLGLASEHPDVQRALRDAGTPGFGKLAITFAEVRGLRGVSREVEFAVDNADWIIQDALGGIQPSMLSMTGTAVGATGEA